MTEDDLDLLVDNDWEVESVSPLEIRHIDGHFATGLAAEYVVDALREETYADEVEEEILDTLRGLKARVDSIAANLGLENDW